MTDIDCANLLIRAYAGGAGWDASYTGPKDDDLFVYRTGDTIVFTGTTDIPGWFRDFQAWFGLKPGEAIDPTAFNHPLLGPLHYGFWQGMDGVWGKFGAGAPKVVTGHSLGAARAIIFGGLLTAAGHPPDAVVTFGEPRAGTKVLASLLAPVAIRSYRNRSDPVCAVPFDVPLIAPYVHPRAFIALDEPGAADDPWLLLRDHHIQLYAAGVAKLPVSQ